MQTPKIVPEDYTPHWNLTLSNEEYHSDRTAVSSSSLKMVIERSPKAFYWSHNGKFKYESNAFRIGSALHMAVLEPHLFKKSYVIMPEFSGKGSVAARSDWKLAQRPDAVILKEDEYNDLQEMINSVLSHQDACNILKNGKAEQSGYFRDPETGILCRIRPDFYHPGLLALLDVKTTTDVRVNEFQRSIWKYRYDFQLAMYGHGIELIEGKKVQAHIILAVEKKPPFECAMYLCDEPMMNHGFQDYQLALKRLKQCIDESMFESYQRQLQPISLPEWVLKKGDLNVRRDEGSVESY